MADRSIQQVRDTLSMVCRIIWDGRPKRGEHVWSIPVDPERDFDCILADAIDELHEWRTGKRCLVTPAPVFRTREQIEQEATAHALRGLDVHAMGQNGSETIVLPRAVANDIQLALLLVLSGRSRP